MLRAVAAVLVLTCGFEAHAQNRTHVDGYMRKDGGYVQPHMRTTPDSSRTNNWSTQGNTNPYTGQMGRTSPYPSTNQGYGSSQYGTQPLYGQKRSPY
jgi:hypothetical protein